MFPSWGAALPQIPQDQAAGCLKSMKQWVTNHSSFSADFLEYFCHSNGDLTNTVTELWEKTLLQGHPPSFSPFFLSSHSSLQRENLVISLDSEGQMILSPKTCGISILNTTLVGSRALREVIQLWGLSRLCRWMSPQKKENEEWVFSLSPIFCYVMNSISSPQRILHPKSHLGSNLSYIVYIHHVLGLQNDEKYTSMTCKLPSQ